MIFVKTTSCSHVIRKMALNKIINKIFFRPICIGLSSKNSVTSTLRRIDTRNILLNNNPDVPLASNTDPINVSKCVVTAKEQIISKLNFETKEHARPFHSLPINTLLHIYKVTKNDEKNGYCKNRLYYIASRLKCPPWLLSKYIAQRTFIYGLSFEWLQKSLDVLLDMGITSDRIIRDLWVLKYKSDTIQERLQHVKDMGVDKLFPWMVRCSDDILKRYICILQETRDILGETESTQIYLANRLNISVEVVNDMCLRNPTLKTIRVTKVKKFLDYLISEGFTVEDIANKSRILSASQKTVKERIDKLRELGYHEINLNILCRTKKSFKKFCEAIDPNNEENS